MSATLSDGHNAGLPDGFKVATDVVGAASPPGPGDELQYVKLDFGAAGASAPVVGSMPASLADGASVTQGAKADAAWDGATAAPTQQSIFKYIAAKIEAVRLLLAGTLTTTVSNFPVTQAVSGTVTVVDSVPLSVSGTVNVGNLPATQTVSAAALPLPAGASTEATLALIKAKTDNLDVLLSSRTKPADTQSTSIADGANLSFGAKADAAWDGAAASPTAVAIWKYISAKLEAIRALLAGTLTVSGTVAVAGVATGTKQDTGNTSLASIDTKTPALGQALAAASTPVVLPAAQITTLTPPAAITGFALEAGHLATMDAKLPSLMAAAPGADTGQSAIPVRVISQLGAGSSSASTTTAAGDIDMTTLGSGLSVTTYGVDKSVFVAITDNGTPWPAGPVIALYGSNVPTFNTGTATIIRLYNSTTTVPVAEYVNVTGYAYLFLRVSTAQAGAPTYKCVLAAREAGADAADDAQPTAISIASAGVKLSGGAELDIGGYDTLGIGLFIPGAAALTFSVQGSVNGSNWTDLQLYPANGGAAVTSINAATTASLDFRAQTAGFRFLRANCSSYTSGSLFVNLQLTPLAFTPPSSSGSGLTDTQLRATPVPVSGTVSTGLTQPLTDTQLRASSLPVTAAQGAPAAVASAWPVKVTDGVSAQAVKAASTAPAAADPAAVVAISPNSPTPQVATTVSSVLQTTANTAQGTAISLAAPGAGLFHIIDQIVITRVNNTATAVAADTTVRQVTSVNLNGWAHELGSALAAGAAETFQYNFPNGLKSQAANTLTSLSMPAGGAGTKFRITVVYRIGT